MASIFREAVTQELHDQPWWLRYKGSILIIATGMVGVISQVAADFQGEKWAPALVAAATVATFVINRFTKDGVTPSQAGTLESAAQKVFQEIPFETGPATVGVAHIPDSAPTPEPARGVEVTLPAPDSSGVLAGQVARAQIEAEHLQANRQG